MITCNWCKTEIARVSNSPAPVDELRFHKECKKEQRKVVAGINVLAAPMRKPKVRTLNRRGM